MKQRFAAYAWFVLAVHVAVVLWGAFVRATGSGAGCGEHWPLCNGEILPRAPLLATIIEFTHRITSGLALLVVIGLVVYAWRVYPKGHLVRLGALLSLIFTLTEALIGAALVLLGHVAKNSSTGRGVTLSIHLVNTLFLLAFIALTAWFATRDAPDRVHFGGTKAMRAMLAIAAGTVLLVGISGGIAALGDTLFKAAGTLADGMRQDFDPASHPFIRLRVLHPVVALLAAVLLITGAVAVLSEDGAGKTRTRLAYLLMGTTFLQVAIGLVNLLLHAPVAIQIVHLFMADTVWITFVLLAADSLATPAGGAVNAGPVERVSV